MNKDELKKEIEQYLINLQIIYDSFNLYKKIKSSVIDYNNEIQSISAFLQVCLYSLETTFFISLSKYFMKNSNENTINNLLNLCEKNSKLFPTAHITDYNYPNGETERFEEPFNVLEDIKQIRKDFKKYNKTISNLRKIRNKYFAHADRNYFKRPNELFKQYSIKNTDLENLINVLYKSLNTLLNDLCSELYCFGDDHIDDFNYLLYKLKK